MSVRISPAVAAVTGLLSLVAVATNHPTIDAAKRTEAVTPVPDPPPVEHTVFLDTNGNFHLYGHPLEWVWVSPHKIPEKLSGRCKSSIRSWPRAIQSTHSGLVLKELVICFEDDRLAAEMYGPGGGREP